MTKWERFFYACLAIGLIVAMGGCDVARYARDCARTPNCLR